MRQFEKTVFISYRRTNIFTARAVYDNLRHEGYDVFFDYENIDSGDFSQIILRSIESRAHFILILTPSALERCQNPNDWLRKEIEHALLHKRNIIPLTFEEFKFKEMREHLPPHIAEPLSQYNGMRVPADFFEEAMTRLRDRYLNIPLNMVLHPAPIEAQQYEQVQQQKATAQPAVTEDDLTAEEYFEQGNAHYDRSEYNSAIADYTEAIRLKPDYAAAYNNRGNSYASMGNHDAAIRDRTEAIRLQPDFALAYNNRGASHYKLGEDDAAINDYTKAIHIKPDYAPAYNNRGEAYFASSQYQDALSDFKEGLSLDPTDKFAVAGSAITRHRLGNVQIAKNLWRQLLDRDERCNDVEWVKDELNWVPPLVEEAKKLIAKL